MEAHTLVSSFAKSEGYAGDVTIAPGQPFLLDLGHITDDNDSDIIVQALAKVHTDAMPARASTVPPCAVACAVFRRSTPVATQAARSALDEQLDKAGDVRTCGDASAAFGASTPLATLAA